MHLNLPRSPRERRHSHSPSPRGPLLTQLPGVTKLDADFDNDGDEEDVSMGATVSDTGFRRRTGNRLSPGSNSIRTKHTNVPSIPTVPPVVAEARHRRPSVADGGMGATLSVPIVPSPRRKSFTEEDTAPMPRSPRYSFSEGTGHDENVDVHIPRSPRTQRLPAMTATSSGTRSRSGSQSGSEMMGMTASLPTEMRTPRSRPSSTKSAQERRPSVRMHGLPDTVTVVVNSRKLVMQTAPDAKRGRGTPDAIKPQAPEGKSSAARRPSVVHAVNRLSNTLKMGRHAAVKPVGLGLQLGVDLEDFQPSTGLIPVPPSFPATGRKRRSSDKSDRDDADGEDVRTQEGAETTRTTPTNDSESGSEDSSSSSSSSDNEENEEEKDNENENETELIGDLLLREPESPGFDLLTMLGNMAGARVENLRKEVFRALRDDGELHKDDALRALELCGFLHPRSSWVDKVWDDISKFATLSEDEFLSFVEGYAQQERQEHERAFAKWDVHGTGFIKVADLRSLLDSCGMNPLQHVLMEVLQEITKATSRSNREASGEHISWKNFEWLMDALSSREGFSKREYEAYCIAFSRFATREQPNRPKNDADLEEKIPVGVMDKLLVWLGYHVKPRTLQRMTDEVDLDRSGWIGQRDFLVLMRKLREYEMGTFQKVSETMTLDKMKSVLVGHLGYPLPNDRVLDEIADELQFGEVVDISGIWQILAGYRACDGFTRQEADEVQEALRLNDKEGESLLDVQGGWDAISSLGCVMSFDTYLKRWSEVKLDGKPRCDLEGFLKLVRIHRCSFVEQVLETFSSIQDSSNRMDLTKIEAYQALLRLDLVDRCTEESTTSSGRFRSFLLLERGEQLADMDEEGACIDSECFCKIALRHFKAARLFAKNHLGFGYSQIYHMQYSFKKYDTDDSGDIEGKELIQLLEDLLPGLASDAVFRPRLLQFMKATGTDGRGGGLTFEAFISLMKQIQIFRFEEHITKEGEKAKEANFPPEEVAQLRSFFLSVVKKSSKRRGENPNLLPRLDSAFRAEVITVDDMFDLINRAEKHQDQMIAYFGKATGQRPVADFPEFLLIARHCMEGNLGNFKTRVTGLRKKSFSKASLNSQSSGFSGSSPLHAVNCR